MKRWLVYSLCSMLSLVWAVANTSATAGKEERKRILIINSYGKQLFWTDELTVKLGDKIRNDHPNWLVFPENLKTESATYTSAAALTLRSILWGYAERTQTKVDATSLANASLFVQDDMPDAIVWVGEEGFMHYLTYVYSMKKWREIPMILCAVNDSVSAYGWRPERTFNFDSLSKINSYHVRSSITALNDTTVEKFRKDKGIKISKVNLDGEWKYQLDAKLNYTGLNVVLPVRKNLELIKHLMPDLKELIWVDDDYYRSMKNRLEVEKVIEEVMPGVKYSKMIHNRMNTDSIYNVMLEPVEHRAFLTYSWNISGLHSKLSDDQIDSLFTDVSIAPLFSLTKRDYDGNNYWVGGCYLDNTEIIDKTISLLDRVLQGDSAMSIPFDSVENGSVLLNRAAVERYGLSKTADTLEEATFVHIPPGFLRKYERQILLSILIFTLIICYLLIVKRRNRYNEKLQKDYVRYKRLYDKLQVIYENCSIDFALYDDKGCRLHRIVNGESDELESDNKDLFSENVFNSPYLNEDLKKQIHEKQIINCEVSFDANGKLSRSNYSGQSIYQLIVKPLYGLNYRSASYMFIAINLTPIVREREEKERYESLFHFASDSFQVGVVFYNVTTAVGIATESWCTTMNETFSPGTFPVYGNVLPEYRGVLLQYQLDIRSGKISEPLCYDIQVRGHDNKLHWVRQHMYYMESKECLVELSLNIDQQKQSENNLKEAKLKAEKANEETGLFQNSISHEVRTPLNAIVGFSAVLVAAEDEDCNREFGPIILRNTRLLNALITNILDLSDLDSGTIEFKYQLVNMADLFNEMEIYIRTNLYNRPLQVIRDLPEWEEDRLIETDKEYLSLLFRNLLSNAMKFTDTGSITLGCRREKKQFYFYVKDTGCGISSEDQKLIFNRFVKLNAYIQGTGLGLSLSKSVVEHLGGEIGVTSRIGEGSTFWFVLPAKERQSLSI